MNKDSSIYIAGHRGLVGSALLRKLYSDGHTRIFGATHDDVDLTIQSQVDNFFHTARPEYVFLCAAKVGGIYANDKYPAEFIYENLMIQTNIIECCRKYKVKKLLNLGSVCIYPKYADVPVKESSLLTGELEPTNQWYAVSKIAGIKMCQAYRKQYGADFISVMPVNQYGVGDNFHPENSHVIPALIRKFVDAKIHNLDKVVCWGTGNARREFMYVDDLADACVFLMDNYCSDEPINIGFGEDYTIKELVELISQVVDYKGEIIWDTEKPDGTPKRLLDSSKLFGMGWKPKVSLKEGLTKTIEWYKIQNKI